MLSGRQLLLPHSSTSPLLLTAAAVSTPQVMCTALTPASHGTLLFCMLLPLLLLLALPDAAVLPSTPPPACVLAVPLLPLLPWLCSFSAAAPPHMNTWPSLLRAIEEAAAATCTQLGRPGTSTGYSLSCSSPVPSAPCPLNLQQGWVHAEDVSTQTISGVHLWTSHTQACEGHALCCS